MISLWKYTASLNSNTLQVKKMMTWLEASIKHKPYVLTKVKKLRETYLAARKQNPLKSWGGKKLIEILVGSNTRVGRGSKNQIEYLNQELTNIIISKMALKSLDGDSKWYFLKGHKLEKTFTSHLMLNSLRNEFPFGKFKRQKKLV